MAKTTIDKWFPGKGFGFCQVEGKRVFVHFSAVSPRPARGTDLTGQELVVEQVDWAADKGPRAVSVVTAAELERRAAVENEAQRWVTLQVSMDPPGFIVDGEVIPFWKAHDQGAPRQLVLELTTKATRHLADMYELSTYHAEELARARSVRRYEQLLEEKTAALILKAKFQRVEDAYPLSSFGCMPTEWDDTVQIHLPAGVTQVVVRHSTWDNDGSASATRAGARQLEIFHSETMWVEHREVAKDSGPALVRMRASVGKDEKVSAEDISSFGSITTLVRHNVVDTDTEMESEYHVSVKGAEMLWTNFCPWYLQPRERLEQARHNAQRILEARQIWAEEFPGTEPGDLDGAVKSLDLHPREHGSVSQGWVHRVEWTVPSFLLMDEESFWAERHERLSIVAQSDSAANERLLTELRDSLLRELIEKLCETTGLEWDESDWWTSNIEPSADGTVPVLAAFVGGQEVARTEVWYTKRGGYPYYRLYEDQIAAPLNYQPGTLEWQVVDQAPAEEEDCW